MVLLRRAIASSEVLQPSVVTEEKVADSAITAEKLAEAYVREPHGDPHIGTVTLAADTVRQPSLTECRLVTIYFGGSMQSGDVADAVRVYVYDANEVLINSIILSPIMNVQDDIVGGSVTVTAIATVVFFLPKGGKYEWTAEQGTPFIEAIYEQRM